jgi:hypothetical protein
MVKFRTTALDPQAKVIEDTRVHDEELDARRTRKNRALRLEWI